MEETIELRTSSKIRKLAICNDYYVYLLEIDFEEEPKDDHISFSHAMSGKNLRCWHDAITEEMKL